MQAAGGTQRDRRGAGQRVQSTKQRTVEHDGPDQAGWTAAGKPGGTAQLLSLAAQAGEGRGRCLSAALRQAGCEALAAQRRSAAGQAGLGIDAWGLR